MDYICLSCGHRWDRDIRATYLQCPNMKCRSRDVVPASFPKMVERARELGISPNTPLRDLLKGFRAVWVEAGIMDLGFNEFIRVVRRVIEAVEKGQTFLPQT